jgi:hypothetical protein
MKDKTKTNLTIATVAVAMFASALWIGTSCRNATENFDKENGVTRLPTGDRIYETLYKGHTYIIIETHRGVGICQKAGDVVWTKEVRDLPANAPSDPIPGVKYDK